MPEIRRQAKPARPMASRIRNEPDETAELKQLLFSPELELLDRVRDRMAVLNSRVGDDPALIESVQRVLVDVLRQSGVSDHDRVAGAMAPLVLETIRREIRNSRQVMLEALYPVAGQLVKAAVAQAMRQIAITVARPVDSVFSPSLWGARFAAWRTGQSVGDVLLARSQAFFVERMLLIHRPMGLLIADSGGGDEDDAEGQQLAAMLSLTQTYARDAFAGRTDGAVRGIAFSDRELHIASSVTSLLAIKTRGLAPGDLEARLQAALVEISTRWSDTLQSFDGALSPADRVALDADLSLAIEDIAGFAPDAAPKRMPKTGLAIVAVAVLGLLGWLGYSELQGWRDRQVEAEAAALVDTAEWKGYPVTFGFDRSESRLNAEGLAPNATAASRLKSGLQNMKRVDALAFAVQPVNAASGQAAQGGALAARVQALEGRNAAGSGVDPVSRITLWLAQHPIHFNSRDRFADERIANQRLDAIAQLLKAWKLNFQILVSGYADQGERRGRQSSVKRANMVVDALAQRGVPRQRLSAIGRGAETQVGPPGDAANRRVTFEIAWR